MRNAVVTGASRGIGRAIAMELAERGYFVLVNFNKSRKQAFQVVEEIKNKGGRAIAMQADVSSYTEVKDMLSDFCEKYGAIHGLVLNAGIYIRKDFKTMSLEDWNRTIAVNLTGAFNVVKAAESCMASGSSIVFIASQLAFRGSKSSVAYGASKAGVLGLMRSLALQLASQGIRVNAISPGTIDTDIIASYTEKQRKDREREIPLGRIGTPEDVAKAVYFLLSEDASYITGANLDVNGGLYIH